MKNLNMIIKKALKLSKLIIIIAVLCSFTNDDSSFYTCLHDFELDDTYTIGKSETFIVKALKEAGFDLKRATEGLVSEDVNIHNWRLLNIKTEQGLISEMTLQMHSYDISGTLKTKVQLKKICINEELEEKELLSKIKEYRKFFKNNVIDKVKQYKE